MISPDTAVVDRAVHGDRDAVAAVLRTVRPMVVRYCLARLGAAHRSHGSAEDVAQEVCLTLLRVLPRYRDEGRPFAAFVYGVAARKVSEALRSGRRRPQSSLDALADHADPADSPEDVVVAADLSARVHALLGHLTPEQREVVVLRVAVGLSADEVAETIGSSAPGVRVVQHRALKKLRRVAGTLLDEVSR
jgi:RNA polymerase sigma-70 factor (ECF subfamily)